MVVTPHLSSFRQLANFLVTKAWLEFGKQTSLYSVLEKNLRKYTEVIYHVLRAERKSTSLNLENPPDFSRVLASQSFVICRREQVSVRSDYEKLLPPRPHRHGRGRGFWRHRRRDWSWRVRPDLGRPRGWIRGCVLPVDAGHQQRQRPVAVPASGLYTV